MTSIGTLMVILMQILNIYLSVAITLKAAFQNNLSNSSGERFSAEIYVVEFLYSEIIAFGSNNNFTYDSETYTNVKTLFVSWF